MQDKALYEKHSDNSGHIYFMRSEAVDGAKVILHVHNAIELKFIVEGSYFIDVGGEKHVCGSGDIVFVGSRRPHAYRSLGKSVNYVLVVGQEYLNAVCPKGKVFSLLMAGGKNFGHLKSLLDETFPLWSRMDAYARKGFVFRLLGTLLQYYPLADDIKDKKENTVAAILEYIDEHYRENLTLETLSKKFGYTKNYFSNIFNKYIGMGIRECVNRCRINKALELIRESEGKISLWGIAEKCGYESLNTFNRAFKRYSPGSGADNS